MTGDNNNISSLIPDNTLTEFKITAAFHQVTEEYPPTSTPVGLSSLPSSPVMSRITPTIIE